MITVILVIHLLLAIALVGTVLLQRSEGGGLGMGGGMSGFMTGRETANLLTRSTAILAAAFFVTSITLAVMSGGVQKRSSIMDKPVQEIPATGTPAEGPSVPLAK